jgi:hypothetical protein
VIVAVKPKLVTLKAGTKLRENPDPNATERKVLSVDEVRAQILSASNEWIGVAKAYGNVVTFTEASNIVGIEPLPIKLDEAVTALFDALVDRTFERIKREADDAEPESPND